MIIAVVAAVRIQQWISRTPELYLVRGASEALRDETKHRRIAERLKKHGLTATTDGHAPDIDGVVVMTATTPEEAQQAVEWLLVRLARKLPGVEWTGWAHEAESYVEAYAHVVVRNQLPSVGSWHRPPLTIDVPIGLACDGCAQEIATESTKYVAERRLGPDCWTRFKSNKWSKEVDKPKDFSALAKTGGLVPGEDSFVVGRRNARNHLATIAADGNRVGDLFKTLADMPKEIQQAASMALDTANETAIAKAREPWDHAATAVMIKHYAGGDDLLLSVAAPVAWPFVTRLAEAFSKAFQDQFAVNLGRVTLSDAQRATLERKCSAVSLGIGLVFANATHPFSHCNQVAHEAMSIAKRATFGADAAVSWVDLTVEEGAVDERAATLSELVDETSATPSEAASARLRVLTLNSSARDAALGILLEGERRGEEPTTIVKHLRRWSTRTGNELPLDGDGSSAETLAEVAALLDRARWWPALTTESEMVPA